MFESLPSIELLESTHAFPGRYTFKAIGSSEDYFVRRVLSAVKTQLPASAEPAFSCRSTANGRHVCVTIEPDVQGAAQVLEIYRQLQGVDGMVMLL